MYIRLVSLPTDFAEEAIFLYSFICHTGCLTLVVSRPANVKNTEKIMKNVKIYKNKFKEDLNALYDLENYIYFNYDLFLNDNKTDLEIRFLKEHLEIEKRHKILDLACGYGRHVNVLAESVNSIVGIDNHEGFLKKAKNDAKINNISNVTFIHKDMREVCFEEMFDRVTMLCTAFGFYSDEENQKVLESISRSLKAGGMMCFDLINRDNSLVNFEPHWVYEKEGNYLIDRLSFDPETGRMLNKRIYIKEGVMMNAPFSIRIYNYTEIKKMLERANLIIQKVYENWNGTTFGQDSKKMVIIAKKNS